MTRRSIVAAISICVHAIVLIVLMTADLWRPITEWPTPRSALAFVDDIRPVHVEPIDPPRPGRARDVPGSPAQSQSDAAPVTPPPDIAAEPVSLPSFVSVSDEGNPIGPGPLSSGGPGSAAAVPPPAPEPKTPVRLHSGIRAPQRLVYVAPIYPSIAQGARVQGMVIIEATIDEQGKVIRAQILRSVPLLDDAALTAVRQWTFSPTLLNGVPVPIVMTVTVNFTLQ